MTERTDLAKTAEVSGDIMHKLVGGDIGGLSPKEQVAYYLNVCRSLGLNYLTQPFNILELDGKTVLYATRSCSDQLRQINSVSVTIAARERIGDVYSVTARATDRHGRADESTGVVALVKEDGEWKTSDRGKRYFAKNGKLIPLVGDGLANAYMKAETKAKRRVTLSICGLGYMDETEAETIPGAQKIDMPVAPVVEVAADAEVPPANAESNPSEPPAERDNHRTTPAEDDARLPSETKLAKAIGPKTLFARVAASLEWTTEDIRRWIAENFDGRETADLTRDEWTEAHRLICKIEADAQPPDEPASDLPFDKLAKG